MSDLEPHHGTNYRLTAEDESCITERLIEVVSGWTPSERQDGGTNRLTLQRIAAHSIGCTLPDLRDSEVEWLNGRITRVITEGS